MTKITEELNWEITLAPKDEESEMFITISTNDPQMGSSTLQMPLGGFEFGVITHKKLGKGKDLHGKKFSCHTLVTDFDQTSDDMVLNFDINDYAKSLPETANENEGSVLYKVNIKFI